eukprot:9046654-Pyramimonas_sp.AAC.1
MEFISAVVAESHMSASGSIMAWMILECLGLARGLRAWVRVLYRSELRLGDGVEVDLARGD